MHTKLHAMIITAMLAWAMPQAAQAVPQCMVSASVRAYDYPGAAGIPTTNNLILPTGKAVAAEGQKVMISGQVRDQQCAPVAGAVVDLWQASPLGRYLLAGRDDLASPNPVFAGAGRTYTDSEGAFSFITAFPAPARYQAPNLNIRVKAEKFPLYTSALFFSDDTRNDADMTYRKLSGNVRQNVTIAMQQTDDGELLGTLAIILPGKAPYRVY